MTTGPFTPAERYWFDLHGFVVRRGALSVDEVAALNDGVSRLNLPPTRPTDIGSQRFAGHLGVHPSFATLLDHPAVFEILVELCGPTVRLDHTYGIVMNQGDQGLGLHGGGHLWDPAQYYAVDRTGIHTGLVAVQWAISGSRAGDGGFACVPGSHKAAFAPPPDLGLQHPSVVEVPLGVGDMVVFTEALMHGTLPWRGTNQRRTLLYKYSPGSSSWSADHEPPAGPVLDGLSPRQRLLFQKPAVHGHQPVR